CNDWDNTTRGSEDNVQDQTQDPDWRHFILSVPMAREPGSLSLYCAGSPNLVGGMLERITGRSIEELFYTLVAQPLQFGRYYLNLDPSGHVYLGGGMHVLPRDFMKFAQLLLNGGVWHGTRLLATDFARQATTTQTHIDQRRPSQRPDHVARKYG